MRAEFISIVQVYYFMTFKNNPALCIFFSVISVFTQMQDKTNLRQPPNIK